MSHDGEWVQVEDGWSYRLQIVPWWRRRRVWRRILSALLVIALTALILAAIATSPLPHVQDSHGDPRHGPTFVSNDGTATTTKVCNGTTLIYVSHSAQSTSNAVVPNSPECQP